MFREAQNVERMTKFECGFVYLENNNPQKVRLQAVPKNSVVVKFGTKIQVERGDIIIAVFKTEKGVIVQVSEYAGFEKFSEKVSMYADMKETKRISAMLHCLSAREVSLIEGNIAALQRCC